MAFELLPVLSQVTEELEVLDHRPSLLVYSHPAGTHQTVHQVGVSSHMGSVDTSSPSCADFPILSFHQQLQV